MRADAMDEVSLKTLKGLSTFSCRGFLGFHQQPVGAPLLHGFWLPISISAIRCCSQTEKIPHSHFCLFFVPCRKSIRFVVDPARKPTYPRFSEKYLVCAYKNFLLEKMCFSNAKHEKFFVDCVRCWWFPLCILVPSAYCYSTINILLDVGIYAFACLWRILFSLTETVWKNRMRIV